MVGGGYFANFGALALLECLGMAVGLLQERGFMYGLLEPAFTSEQEHRHVECNAQIEPGGVIADFGRERSY